MDTLSEILPMIIVLCVIVISSLRSVQKKKTDNAKPKKGVWSEAFPTIEAQAPQPTKRSVKESSKPSSKHVGGSSRFRPFSESLSPAGEMQNEPQQETKKREATKLSIRLKEKEEAKRAFIHTEIFQRKY